MEQFRTLSWTACGRCTVSWEGDRQVTDGRCSYGGVGCRVLQAGVPLVEGAERGTRVLPGGGVRGGRRGLPYGPHSDTKSFVKRCDSITGNMTGTLSTRVDRRG